MSRHRVVTCRECNALRPHAGRGLCGGCYQRLWAAGTLPPLRGPRPRQIKPGDQFGRLTVIQKGPRTRDGHITWVVMCECATVKRVRANNLPRQQSCGCIVAEISAELGRRIDFAARNLVHGHAARGQESPTYRSWYAMLNRCRNPKDSGWRYYGGRGITVCDRWEPKRGGGFANFLADMGERPEGRTLDRIDSDGNYEPQNCRWATQEVQMLNRKPRQVVAA